MYKVKKEDPRIIAMFSESPRGPGDFVFPSSADIVGKRWKALEPFLTNGNVNVLKKVERLYEFVDWYITVTGVREKAVCQRGCAHCCYLDVDVTLIEALYLAKKTGNLTVIDRNERLRAKYEVGHNYCQFLDKNTGTCTVYEYRPLACRSFMAFDNPKFCELDADGHGTEHAIYVVKSSQLVQFIGYQLERMSSGRFADIREWFVEHSEFPWERAYAKDATFEYVNEKPR